MIETSKMYEDLRTDKVGMAISAMRSVQIWNHEKHALKLELWKCMTESAYSTGTGTAHAYQLTGGAGFSYLYQVPSRKQWQLKIHRGELIRIVHAFSGNRTVNFSFSAIAKDQQGRSYHSIAKYSGSTNFDVRKFYPFSCGESKFLNPGAT